MRATLWHLRDSHFNEKARWALDRKRFPHTRRSPLAGFHMLVGQRLAGEPTLPVLVIDRRAIGGAANIIAELDRLVPERPLIPADPALRARALALQDELDSELASQIRLFGLFHTLRDPETVAAMNGPYLDPVLRAGIPLILPGLRRLLFWNYGITAETAAEARRRTLAAVDRLEGEIGPSGYLVGDGFTVADLTGASMLAPLLRPPGFPYPAVPVGGPVAELRDEIAARPAGRWAGEMYARHRLT